MSEWQKEMTDRIGKQVEELRGEMTALKLSELTEKLGMKISRSALSDLENGKRKSISLAEFLILAAALEVPPIFLLWPDYPDGLTEFLPGLATRSFEAANWFGGEQVLKINDRNELEVKLHGFPERKVRLSKLRDSLLESALLDLHTDKGDPIDLLIELRQKKADLNRQIADAGGVIKDVEG